jgi:hypothetical protein
MPTPSAPVQRTAYLADLPIVDQRIGEPGSATIAGVPYVHSIILDPDNVDNKAWADFDLGSHYTRLHATVGMLSSDSEGSLAWEVFANGQSIKHGVVGLYRGVSLDLNLTGVQRLRISAALVGDFNSLWSENLKLAFGDATLTVDLANPPIPSPSS